MKIAICSIRHGDYFREITKYTEINKKEYCSKHDYTLITDYDIVPNKSIHWSKITMLQKYIDLFDYVVWMDADLFIMNTDIKLESFIEHRMKDKDIMTGGEWGVSNTGVVFVKNTEWSKKFLDSWLNSEDTFNKGNWDQGVFQSLCISNKMEEKDHILATEHHELNSYWFNYFKGHFILHMAGCSYDLSELKRTLDMYCPIRMDEDTDESYEKRMKWLEHEYRIFADQCCYRKSLGL